MTRRNGLRLALDGGQPVRKTLLPYARQQISEADVAAVADVLRSDWLTTGPAVRRLEEDLAAFVGSEHAVAVNSGTAALHCLMFAIGVGEGDEVVMPAMTFSSTANVVVHLGGTPVFADVDSDSLLMDPASAQERCTTRTKAVLGVDYAGQPCDYDRLAGVAGGAGALLVADGCHALGAALSGRPVGSIASATAFSFHAVKHVAMGEGGALTTSDAAIAARARLFRNHGIDADHLKRAQEGSWIYDLQDIGLNYRVTDIQAALGSAQLKHMPEWLQRRRALAARYDEAFRNHPAISPLVRRENAEHAYHLYVIRLRPDAWKKDRAVIFAALRAEGIGVNVHYIPVHLLSYYRQRYGLGEGQCPRAEAAYQSILTLPLFPGMTDDDLTDVVEAVKKVHAAYGA